MKQLLKDLLEFSEKERRSGKEIYCLQPIVVKKLDRSDKKLQDFKIEGSEVYEVIDGQQRLTTIFLILKFLNRRFVLKSKERFFK